MAALRDKAFDERYNLFGRIELNCNETTVAKPTFGTRGPDLNVMALRILSHGVKKLVQEDKWKTMPT